MNESSKHWLGGLLDGDGTFTISLTERNNSILITPQIKIGLKSKDGWILKIIQKELGGKLYESNKGTEDAITAWQTTNAKDSLEIAKVIVPYTKLKNYKGNEFINACKFIIKTSQYHHSRKKGSRGRTKQEILQITKMATSLNPDRQSIRFRKYKNYNWWKKRINKLYVTIK